MFTNKTFLTSNAGHFFFCERLSKHPQVPDIAVEFISGASFQTDVVNSLGVVLQIEAAKVAPSRGGKHQLSVHEQLTLDTVSVPTRSNMHPLV